MQNKDQETYYADDVIYFIFDRLCWANGLSGAHSYLERETSIYVGGHGGVVRQEGIGEAFLDDASMIHDIIVDLIEEGIELPKERVGYTPKKW